MNDYTKIINSLSKKGVKFTTGLNDEEIVKIEKLYDFIFPKELKDFLQAGLPISNGFYNWRDESNENIIKAINKPLEDLLFDIEYNNFWINSWGEIKENKINIKKEKFLKKYAKAPKLIPVYNHRYIPAIRKKNVPILSVMGSDIIVYGENLKDYLEREFHLIEKKQLKYNKYDIKFWGEIIC